MGGGVRPFSFAVLSCYSVSLPGDPVAVVAFAAAAAAAAAMKLLHFCAPVLCLLWLGQASLAVDIEEEEGVLVLKTANFEQALEQYPNILVEFCEWRRGAGGAARRRVCVCMGFPSASLPFRDFEAKAPFCGLTPPCLSLFLYPGRGPGGFPRALSFEWLSATGDCKRGLRIFWPLKLPPKAATLACWVTDGLCKPERRSSMGFPRPERREQGLCEVSYMRKVRGKKRGGCAV